jgi:hypothetical protein
MSATVHEDNQPSTANVPSELFSEPIEDNDLMRCPGFLYDEQADSKYPSLKAAQRRLKLTKVMNNFILTLVGGKYFQAACRVPKDDPTWTTPVYDKHNWGYQLRGKSYIPFGEDFKAPHVVFESQISPHVYDVQIKEVHVSTLHLRFCTIAILRLI